MKHHATYEIIRHPEYVSTLDEFRDDDGSQHLLMHIDVFEFSAAVLRKMLHEWAVLRECIEAPIYAFEPAPDDEKWERFVTRMGFQKTEARIPYPDGTTRRVFISVRNKNNGRSNDHYEYDAGAVGRASSVSEGRLR